MSGAQVFGSALASATSAFAASSLGVAGTIVGALIGSLILTTASAIYSHSLRKVGRQIRVAHPTTATETMTPDDDDDEAGPKPSVKRRRLPWRQVAVVAVVGSVLAVGGITVFETVIGHPVSSPGSSGTSIGDVVRGDLTPTPAPDKQDPKAPGNSDSDQDTPGQSPVSPDAPAEQQSPADQPPPAEQQPPTNQAPPVEPAPQDGQQPPAEPAPQDGQQPPAEPAPQEPQKPAPQEPQKPAPPAPGGGQVALQPAPA